MKSPPLCIKACFLLLFILSALFAQTQTVQELQYSISRPELTEKERINTLYTLSRELTYVDNIKSLEYVEEALTLATYINDIDGIAYSYRILSSIYALNDNYFMGMEYIQKAIDIFEDRGDKKGLANCYISLGHIYRSLNNREQEIEYHKKSFEAFTLQGIKERIGVSAHNLGESYYNNEEFIKAEQLTRLAIQINDSIANLPVLSSCYKVMGLIKENEGQLDSAGHYFNKVIKISDELGDNAQKVATAEAFINLATMAGSAKNDDLEFEYLANAEAFCRKYNLNKFLLRVYREMQTFYLMWIGRAK
ncbi:tetratricopeptide repeat protein [Maribacter litoralis]|uniref:tetratricopeptide repeat protein n=1 Tax=Maribacter litoralis TaxID=2059726 RepID=UPI003F5CDA92